MNFIYTINPESKEPILKVDKLIRNGDTEGMDVINGTQFSREVFELDCLKPDCIRIPVNSFGGSVAGALAMIGAMISISTPTITRNWGWAESSAGWVLLCGTEVEVMEYSYFMCHMPQGKVSDDELARMAMQIATILSGCSGRRGKARITPGEFLEMMKVETHLKPKEMWDMGLCDRVYKSNGEEINYDLVGYAAVTNEAIPEDTDKENAYRKFSEILNQSIIKKEIMADTNTIHELINSTLGLKGDAPVGDTLKSINTLMLDKEKNAREITNAGEDREALAKKLLEAEKAKNEANDCYNKAKDEMDAMDAENKRLKAENEGFAKKEEVLNERIATMDTARGTELLDRYTGLGKIKAEDAAVWQAALKTSGYDTVKNQLESLPTNAPGVAVVGDKKIPLAFNGAKDDADFRRNLKRNRALQA